MIKIEIHHNDKRNLITEYANHRIAMERFNNLVAEYLFDTGIRITLYRDKDTDKVKERIIIATFSKTGLE